MRGRLGPPSGGVGRPRPKEVLGPPGAAPPRRGQGSALKGRSPLRGRRVSSPDRRRGPPWGASRRGQGPFLFLREKKKRALTPKKKSYITERGPAKTAASGFTPCGEDRPRPLRPPVVEQGEAVVLSLRRLALRRADGWSLLCSSAAVGVGVGFALRTRRHAAGKTVRGDRASFVRPWPGTSTTFRGTTTGARPLEGQFPHARPLRGTLRQVSYHV